MTEGAEWWRSIAIYQIYPRSFADSNGDGIGDLRGIIAKLDYLASLGVGAIWLSPVFQSPMDDNGYDISDYRAIAPEFGTLADFDELVIEARMREIGIVLDLVVNHTSDEHEWFREARKSRDSRYRDYYVWRDPAVDGGPPSDLKSTFGGSAWKLDEQTGQYFLHLFSPRQPDLNWKNAELREEIYAMMNWWLSRGIMGFRMDVIDLIGKDIDYDITADGPMLHEYLQEMNARTFGKSNVLTVGEAWSATPASALLYSGQNRNELSMVFQFEHVTQQWDLVFGKWRPKPFDLVELKSVFGKWQLALARDGWNSLFWGNHDLPRAVSRYGDVTGYHVESAKLLATVLHFMKGTPFVFQGEEIGMTNANFTSIDQYRDIETLNMYRIHRDAGLSPEDFIAGANTNGRDNARTPMQWSKNSQAGFTTGVPWIELNANFERINVADSVAHPQSIWNHYRQLIALRKRYPVIVHGDYLSYFDQDKAFYVYERRLNEERLLVVANFSSHEATLMVPPELRGAGTCLIANYDEVTRLDETYTARPYEAFALLRSGLPPVQGE